MTLFHRQVSMQYNPAAAAVRLGGEVDGVPGGESDDERDNKSNQDNGPDGGKFISGQAPKPMKRPYLISSQVLQYICEFKEICHPRVEAVHEPYWIDKHCGIIQ